METVLVVDDNAEIVEVLSEYLRAEGFTAIAATDGDEALRAAGEHRPDLALVDVMLPGVDGLELTRRFRAQHIPVILVTARTAEEDRLVGFGIGAEDYVVKPFSPREVVARVKVVLRRFQAPSEGPDVSVGELALDARRRSVEVAGAPVELTRTEFDMLLAMAAHPGRVYTRAQLLHIAEGPAARSSLRTVDAHVKNMRRKLGDPPRAPRYLHTVHGVGYKVEA